MSNPLKDEVLSAARSVSEKLVQIRRDLHQHPEIGLQEHRTAKLVVDTLRPLGVEVEEGFYETGVVGLIRGAHPGKTVLIRADMDALPVQELADPTYKSQCDGKMHACGHDAHTTWLLGVGMILTQLKGELHGNVKLMFQPAEECPGGAEAMIGRGILRDPPVDMALGAHVTPSCEAGEYIIEDGPITANPDFFKLTLRGKGAHGSTPEEAVDPINMGVQVYSLLQSFVSRLSNPCDPVVLSVCMFQSGSARGILPECCELQGTVRSFKADIRRQAKEWIDKAAQSVTQLYGGSYELYYEATAFPIENHPALSAEVRRITAELLGGEAVLTGRPKFMGGEDFCFIAREVPSTFLFTGCRNDEKLRAVPLHNPYFDIDEDILATTAALLSYTALRLLAP